MDWTNIFTEDAVLADRKIMEHVSCEHIDTESITFSCYDSIRWIG